MSCSGPRNPLYRQSGHLGILGMVLLPRLADNTATLPLAASIDTLILSLLTHLALASRAHRADQPSPWKNLCL